MKRQDILEFILSLATIWAVVGVFSLICYWTFPTFTPTFLSVGIGIGLGWAGKEYFDE